MEENYEEYTVQIACHLARYEIGSLYHKVPFCIAYILTLLIIYNVYLL